MKKRVLFACVENSNRSQMAEAFARIHWDDVLEPFSAGSRASGEVNPKAVAAMRERGYDLTTHRSKTLDEVPAPFDYVITMGCGEECPFVAARRREDWELPDPKALPPEAFNEVRDEIERRVLALVEEVRRERRAPAAGRTTWSARRGRPGSRSTSCGSVEASRRPVAAADTPGGTRRDPPPLRRPRVRRPALPRTEGGRLTIRVIVAGDDHRRSLSER